jgi:hypothetical protein
MDGSLTGTVVKAVTISGHSFERMRVDRSRSAQALLLTGKQCLIFD